MSAPHVSAQPEHPPMPAHRRSATVLTLHELPQVPAPSPSALQCLLIAGPLQCRSPRAPSSPRFSRAPSRPAHSRSATVPAPHELPQSPLLQSALQCLLIAGPLQCPLPTSALKSPLLPSAHQNPLIRSTLQMLWTSPIIFWGGGGYMSAETPGPPRSPKPPASPWRPSVSPSWTSLQGMPPPPPRWICYSARTCLLGGWGSNFRVLDSLFFVFHCLS